ncbi:MAG: response regulator transcription factor [Anaerolineales bacterium]|nr:response regulator transcription factor [Anaerolineales bacterium]
MTDNTILVVEDEPQIVKIIQDYLERACYRVLTADNGEVAISIARQEQPILVLLDLMLPGDIDGLEICRSLRRDRMLSGVPIIMLTARVEEMDRLIGLELGADDYITKPFSPREMVARVKAVLRRTRGEETPANLVQIDRLEVNMDVRKVTFDNKPVKLTPTEYDLLAEMARYPGRPFSREQLMNRVYNTTYTGYDRAIDSHIKNLRRKIEPDARQPQYILTVYGVGYQLSEGSSAGNEQNDGSQPY